MESQACGAKASFLDSVLVWRGCPTCQPTHPQGGAQMEEGRYLSYLLVATVALVPPTPWLCLAPLILYSGLSLVLIVTVTPFCCILRMGSSEDISICFTGTVRDPASLLLLLTLQSWGPRSICLLPSISQFLPWLTYALFSGFIITLK